MSFTIGPYAVTRGAIIPYGLESQTDQTVSIDGDGGVVVTERPYSEQFFRVKIKGTAEEMEAVKGFIENGVRFSAVPFNITDDWSTVHYVRFWGNKVSWEMTTPGICEMDLLFRKEI